MKILAFNKSGSINFGDRHEATSPKKVVTAGQMYHSLENKH